MDYLTKVYKLSKVFKNISFSVFMIQQFVLEAPSIQTAEHLLKLQANHPMRRCRKLLQTLYVVHVPHAAASAYLRSLQP